MKKNEHSLLYFLNNPLRVAKSETTAGAEQNKTPFLKAILSGTTLFSKSGADLVVENPDQAAALRYIKESNLLRRS